MQKYLFLVSREQKNPSYHFVPYHFGCYSFQADADKRTLTKYGLIRDHNKWVLDSKERFLHGIKPEDRIAIARTAQHFGQVRGHDLVRHVYQTYPYYAINSDIRTKILDPEELKKVEASRPTGKPARLFTIGYEGQSLEQFLNKLIEQSVAVLCDVRRNPVSMKFGFSKRQLKQACEGTGIGYVHMPELGIDSQKRRHLKSRSDYVSLFRDYVKTTLLENKDALDSITRQIRDNGSVALTCFEADPNQCHRGCVASELRSRVDFKYQVAHL